MPVIIQRMADDQVEAAKAVIRAGALEFFGEKPHGFEDMEAELFQYREPTGTFLVLTDDERVVGTGAIRRLDDETCELKRMWFLPPYRGRGYGMMMSEMLLDFARAAGYRRIRLDSAEILTAAHKMYLRLGFYPIERYNAGPATIFMEKML